MNQPLDVTASLSKSELKEQQFLEVLESCQSLGSHHAEYSSIPYESVDRLCEIAQDVVAELLSEWRGVEFQEILDKQAQYQLNGN